MSTKQSHEYKGVTIELPPDFMIAYSDAKEKGYRGSLSNYLDDLVKEFMEMRSR